MATPTQPTTAAQPPAKRLPSLDVLRFAAAIAVMIYHFTYGETEVGFWAAMDSVTRYFFLSVELFFIISGFVVLWSAKGRTVLGFARARLLRLYPEFWIAVLISAVVFNITKAFNGDSLTLRDVLVNLTMIPQHLGVRYVDGVYWTLGLEIKFYVLLAVLILTNQIKRVELWIYAGLALMSAHAVMDLGGIVSSLTLGRYGALFAAGGLFFIVHDEGWTLPRKVGLVVAALLSMRNAVENMAGFVRPEDITASAPYTTAALIIGMFVTFALIIRSEKEFSNVELASTLGALTYPLYLLHNTGKAIFLRSFVDLPIPLTIRVLAATVFSLTLAYAVYNLGTRFVKPKLALALAAIGLRK